MKISESLCSWCDFGVEEPDDCVCDGNCGAIRCLGMSVEDIGEIIEDDNG